MGAVGKTLATMGMEQVLLAFVILGSYAVALGAFVDARGRTVAIATSILAAVGFAAFSDPWEAGVVLVALVPIGMALLAAAAWTLWKMVTWQARRARSVEVAPAQPAPQHAAMNSLFARVWAHMPFV